jgi:hypothetical protein
MRGMQEKTEDEENDREEIIARMDANIKATLAIQLKKNETEEDMKNHAGKYKRDYKKTMEEVRTMNQAMTDGKLNELIETNEKTQMVLETVEVSLDTQARNLQENLEVIKALLTTDFSMVGIEVKTTRKDAVTQKRILEENTEANTHDFQARLEEVGARNGRRSTPTFGVS